MPRTATRGACFAFLFFVPMFLVETAAARSIRAYVFDLNPDHTYRVQLDGTDQAVLYSGAAGAVDVGVDASNGSLVTFIDDGSPNLQPPAPPLFTNLDTSNPGCASASWAPSGDPTVTGYVVSYGDAPGLYDRTVNVTAGTSAEVCMLPLGRHYFVVQCRNYAGMLSAYSTERSVNIVVVAVLISQFDARVENGGVRLSWVVETDENIQGYHVYRSGPDQIERPLTDSPIAPTQNSYFDGAARSATRYAYVLAAINEAGDEIRSFPVDVDMPALTLSLGQNAPNPFNPMTSIPFVLDASTRVILRVYDVRGALVATLFDGVLGEGSHRIPWNGRNDAGRPVSSGTYLYSLIAGNRQLARKMLMVR